jgi:hypothetical protein
MVRVLRRLVARIRDLGLRIRRVLLDRAFSNVSVVECLPRENLPFRMPMVIRGRAAKKGQDTDGTARATCSPTRGPMGPRLNDLYRAGFTHPHGSPVFSHFRRKIFAPGPRKPRAGDIKEIERPGGNATDPAANLMLVFLIGPISNRSMPTTAWTAGCRAPQGGQITNRAC